MLTKDTLKTTLNKQKSYEDPLVILASKEEIVETKNLLYYQLFCSFPTPNFTKEENVIEYIIDIIEKSPTFIKFSLPYNLFGQSDFYAKHAYKHTEKLKFENEFSESLYTHCAISSLHTVNYLLHKIKPQDSKSLDNFNSLICRYDELEKDTDYAKSAYATPGYFTLYSTKNQPRRLAYFQEWDLGTFNSYINKFTDGKALELPFAQSLLGVQNQEKEIIIPMYNIDFYNHIIKYNQFLSSANTCAFLNKDMASTRFENLMGHYQDISYTIPFPLEDDETSVSDDVKIDFLILQYQLERYFNADILNTLCKVSEDYENTNYALLFKFLTLPNAFSRKLYIEWAFSSYGKIGVFSNHLSQPAELSNKMVRSIDKDIASIPHKTEISLIAEWEKNTDYALDFLSKVYFPFYEKYFFVFLYEICKKELKRNKYLDVLELMQKHLYDYCLKKYETIDIPRRKGAIHSALETKHFYMDMLNRLIKESDLCSFHRKKYTREYFYNNNYNLSPAQPLNEEKFNLYGNQIRYFKQMAMIEPATPKKQ